MPFTAWSPSLKPGQRVPENYVFNGMGCHGKNISPPLAWREAPPATKSFAITVHDPDAPKSGGFWHWAVVNIPANVYQIEEGASNQHTLPKNALELKSDFGEAHYGGPCPPKGDKPHHYVFTVYAMREKALMMSSSTSPESIKDSLEHTSLAKSTFSVEYGR